MKKRTSFRRLPRPLRAANGPRNHTKPSLTGNALLALAGLLLCPAGAVGQAWHWEAETVDTAASFSSLAVDQEGNLHIAYSKDGEGIKYGFRPAQSPRWFSMVLEKATSYTALALDPQGNPHVCYTPGVLKYAHWNGQKWNVQEIAPDSGQISFTCSVAVSPEGNPQLIWYHYKTRDRALYLHLKYAILRDGTWMVRTVDFDGQTGKWNSMALDPDGSPHLSYSAYTRGSLKYARWDGKRWAVTTVDGKKHGVRGATRGMGNSVSVGPKGEAHISYFEGLTLKYARREENAWAIRTIDRLSPAVGIGFLGLRSSLVLDKNGDPHIIYGDAGALKHAYWDGEQWRIQLIAAGGMGQYRYTSATVDQEGSLHVSYTDGLDGSLKVATGRLVMQALENGSKEAAKGKN